MVRGVGVSVCKQYTCGVCQMVDARCWVLAWDCQGTIVVSSTRLTKQNAMKLAAIANRLSHVVTLVSCGSSWYRRYDSSFFNSPKD